DGKTPLHEKKITSEVCIHHLWFDRSDYEVLGNLIKWNPAVKNKEDREALWESLLNHKLDVVATDHAPHLLDEKLNEYTSSASGGPLVQHSLQAMAHMIKERNLPFHLLTRWMCHNPAIAYKVRNRGFIRKGYFADLVILKEKPFTVSKDNILYKCGWSPFENHTFDFTVTHTIINGEMVNDHGKIAENFRGRALRFDR
ncbi:MAG: amidohydrolase family protein, partial [Bacteroidota bacterium]